MTPLTDTSLLDRLRQKRNQLAAKTTEDFPLPGYGGELLVRYRLLDPLVEGKDIGQRAQRAYPKPDQETELLHQINLDTVIAACVGFYVRRPDGEIEMLDPDGTGPLDYGDPRLHDFLGFEASTAREAVVEVFGGQDHRSAVNVHAQMVLRWMGDPTSELNQGLLGG